ncbi:uncharacterized protein LOC144727911 [Lampetra planeri]
MGPTVEEPLGFVVEEETMGFVVEEETLGPTTEKAMVSTMEAETMGPTVEERTRDSSLEEETLGSVMERPLGSVVELETLDSTTEETLSPTVEVQTRGTTVEEETLSPTVKVETMGPTVEEERLEVEELQDLGRAGFRGAGLTAPAGAEGRGAPSGARRPTRASDDACAVSTRRGGGSCGRKLSKHETLQVALLYIAALSDALAQGGGAEGQEAGPA